MMSAESIVRPSVRPAAERLLVKEESEVTFSLSGRPVRSVVPPLFRGDMSDRQATVLESAYGNNTPPAPVKLGEEIGRLSSLSSLFLKTDHPRGSATRLDF